MASTYRPLSSHRVLKVAVVSVLPVLTVGDTAIALSHISSTLPSTTGEPKYATILPLSSKPFSSTGYGDGDGEGEGEGEGEGNGDGLGVGVALGFGGLVVGFVGVVVGLGGVAVGDGGVSVGAVVGSIIVSSFSTIVITILSDTDLFRVVAFMVTFPGDLAKMTPYLLTVATSVLLEVQLIES